MAQSEDVAAIAVGDGVEVEHIYGSPRPDDEHFVAIVTIVRQPGCNPLGQSEDVEIPNCPTEAPDCPELDSIQVDGCAPGDVTLRATGSNLNAAVQMVWDFGDRFYWFII